VAEDQQLAASQRNWERGRLVDTSVGTVA